MCFMKLWSSFPPSITELVGHHANHGSWEQKLQEFPLHALQPNWQVLQSKEDGSASQASVWGLQSLTLHTAASETGEAWSGEWPDALPADQSTIHHTNAIFGEPLLHSQGIALYQMQSPKGLSWAVHCMFSEWNKLQHLTFVRMHDWEPLSVSLPMSTTALDRPAPEQPDAPDWSPAGSQAPLQGWYEAILPPGHPMQAYFANSEMRLVFREQSEKFPTLGVTPESDESLVRWRWLRAQ